LKSAIVFGSNGLRVCVGDCEALLVVDVLLVVVLDVDVLMMDDEDEDDDDEGVAELEALVVDMLVVETVTEGNEEDIKVEEVVEVDWVKLKRLCELEVGDRGDVDELSEVEGTEIEVVLEAAVEAALEAALDVDGSLEVVVDAGDEDDIFELVELVELAVEVEGLERGVVVTVPPGGAIA
jgi:hypothetical protein